MRTKKAQVDMEAFRKGLLSEAEEKVMKEQ